MKNEAEKEKNEEDEKKGKKLGINMKYVEIKARRQYKSAVSRQNQKRNNNKDKGV